MAFIQLSTLKQFVENKSFEELKTECQDLDIHVKEFNYIKEVDLSQLYLLYSEKDDTLLQRQCNGIILEKETNNLVCSGHNKFILLDPNVESSNMMKLNEHKKHVQIEFEYCEDGTVIRLYNYKGMWMTSTTKCIDARHSYWSNEKSFGHLFWELFDFSYLEMLDHKCTYFFILKHVDNRIVIKHDKSSLVYVHTVDNKTNEIFNDKNMMCYNEIEKHSQNTEVISLQSESQSESRDEMYDVYPRTTLSKVEPMQYIEPIHVVVPNDITFDQLEELYHPKKRGVIIKTVIYQHLQYYQYDYATFRKIASVRGNVPLVRMRYLELLNDQENLSLLEQTYPEHMMIFTLIKHSLENLYKQIHKLYIDSHVKHNITVENTHKYYQTLRQLHGEYKTKGHMITLDKVKEKVNSLEPYVIKKFIGWF